MKFKFFCRLALSGECAQKIKHKTLTDVLKEKDCGNMCTQSKIISYIGIIITHNLGKASTLRFYCFPPDFKIINNCVFSEMVYNKT